MDHLAKLRLLASEDYNPNLVITKELMRGFRDGLDEGALISDPTLQQQHVQRLQGVLAELLLLVKKLDQLGKKATPGQLPHLMGDARLFRQLSGLLEAYTRQCGKVYATDNVEE